jgi:hypothetical protein
MHFKGCAGSDVVNVQESVQHRLAHLFKLPSNASPVPTAMPVGLAQALYDGRLF